MALVNFWAETQTLTRDDPTLVTEGLHLGGRERGLRVVVSAPSGQTLLGTGTLKCWYWDNSLLEWVRVPDFDLVLTDSHAGKRRVAFPDQSIVVPDGRMLYAASGVTVSSGTTADVRVVVYR